MLIDLLNDAQIAADTCASLLGLSSRLFKTWVDGKRDLPGYIIPELASVLGVSQEALATGSVREAPAIWFKFRESGKLSDVDRELVVLIRRLGFYQHQLDLATSVPNNRWQLLFKFIDEQLTPNHQASPSIQGREAAKVLRDQLNLGFPRKSAGVKGNGDLIRPILRNFGVLTIEAPIPESKIEGCSFYVGGPGEQRPCLFVNTYKQYWFRRNHVLMHELAHAIFDIDREAASIDFREETEEGDVKEVRAEAFAAESLISKEMLRHLQSMLGLHWESMSDSDLAGLVAYSQVELRFALRAARDYGFIDAEAMLRYQDRSISSELKQLTERALDTMEFERVAGAPLLPVALRTTTIPSRSLRLPVSYVARVVSAVSDRVISESKAAELLMIDENTFAERFGKLLEEVAA
jgi:Zn-dependent peptidase ImmA (M78 family)/DNA-binding transcriptional regulator YdaS (Cro superfamily)